jgi:predicted small metal-binding protein
MAYSMVCADTGADCPGLFTTETKEELFKHVEVHAEAAHPDLEITDEQVEALIKTT